MNEKTWDNLIKNYVRALVFGYFNGSGFNTFFDIPGRGCLSVIEAFKQQVIRKDSTILWVERHKPTGISISNTLKKHGFNHTCSSIGDVTRFAYDGTIDLVNLDLMGQLTEELAFYIRDSINFSEGAGFSINIHYHGGRKKSKFLTAADRYYSTSRKRFNECINRIKIKPLVYSGVTVMDDVLNLNYFDECVNTIYGILKEVSFQEYDFKVENIIIYGETAQEDNMVTFVFSNITRKKKSGPRNVAARKAVSARSINGIYAIDPTLNR